MIDQAKIHNTSIDTVFICREAGLTNVDFIVSPYDSMGSCPGIQFTGYYAWTEGHFVYLTSKTSSGEGMTEEDGRHGYYSNQEIVYFPSNGLPEDTIVKILVNSASSIDFFDSQKSKIQTDGKAVWVNETQFYRWSGNKLLPVRHSSRLTVP